MILQTLLIFPVLNLLLLSMVSLYVQVAKILAKAILVDHFSKPGPAQPNPEQKTGKKRKPFGLLLHFSRQQHRHQHRLRQPSQHTNRSVSFHGELDVLIHDSPESTPASVNMPVTSLVSPVRLEIHL